MFSLAHVEGITLGAGEEVDEVTGGAASMGVDGIGEVGDRAVERQATGVYRAGFTVGSLCLRIPITELATENYVLFFRATHSRSKRIGTEIQLEMVFQNWN